MMSGTLSSGSVPEAQSGVSVDIGERRPPGGRDRPAERLVVPAVVRLLDLVIAISALTLAAPLLAVAAVAVRLESSGPAIFRQRRLGLYKRPFTIYKLRTMRAEADSSVHRAYVQALIGGSEVSYAQGETSVYKLVADERVTRLGALLRRSSLDELPQLVNVVRGQMSIVGPRPVLAYEAERYPEDFDLRFQVKPGLTGLWQVSGRSSKTYREMIALDLDWVERRSIRLYLLIIARTPRTLLRRKDAA